MIDVVVEDKEVAVLEAEDDAQMTGPGLAASITSLGVWDNSNELQAPEDNAKVIENINGRHILSQYALEYAWHPGLGNSVLQDQLNCLGSFVYNRILQGGCAVLNPERAYYPTHKQITAKRSIHQRYSDRVLSPKAFDVCEGTGAVLRARILAICQHGWSAIFEQKG